MRTVIETPTFQKQAAAVWRAADREAFIDWIAEHPDVGDVIPGADGARVIYFHLAGDEVVLLVMVYTKAERTNVSPKDITRR